MSQSFKVPNGVITLSKVDFNCPKCSKHYDEKFYYKQLQKSKKGLIYKECKGCGEIMGITHDMTGDIVVWLKDEEATHGRIELKSPICLLLEWIVKQAQDLDQYYGFIEPLQKQFLVTLDGREAMKELIERVIKWETSSEYDSLEKVLGETFTVKIKGL